jgi:septum formation protein
VVRNLSINLKKSHQISDRSRARPLILASTSPRRRELLAEAGYDFESIAPRIGECSIGGLTVRELALRNAIRKALAVARTQPDAVVLAADTLVALDHRIIGKPTNLDHAFAILRTLSGQTHVVCSGVVICHLRSGQFRTFHEISYVRFKKLSDQRIRDYFSKINPLDKAGAYAAQGSGAEIIQKIEGSYTNVVGLPMEETIRVLRRFGIASRKCR